MSAIMSFGLRAQRDGKKSESLSPPVVSERHAETS
jgi:hypothetical protein